MNLCLLSSNSAPSVPLSDSKHSHGSVSKKKQAFVFFTISPECLPSHCHYPVLSFFFNQPVGQLTWDFFLSSSFLVTVWLIFPRRTIIMMFFCSNIFIDVLVCTTVHICFIPTLLSRESLIWNILQQSWVFLQNSGGTSWVSFTVFILFLASWVSCFVSFIYTQWNLPFQNLFL